MSTFLEVGEVLSLAVELDGQLMGTYELESGKGVFIGSALQCGVQISGENISPIHCRLSFDGQIIQLHDWMSGSGTLVNGQRIEPDAQLDWNDVVQIGDHTIRLSKSSKSSSDESSSQSPLDEQLAKSCLTSPAPVHTSDQPRTEYLEAAPSAPSKDIFSCETKIAPEFQADTEQKTQENSAALNSANDLDRLSSHGTVSNGGYCLENNADFTADHGNQDEVLTNQEAYEPPMATADLWDSLEFSDSGVQNRHWMELDTGEALITRGNQSKSVSQSQDPLFDSFGSLESDGVDCQLDPSDIARLEQRLQQLLSEADSSDQRIRMLEDLLLAAESAHRAQQDEKEFLESWLDDIEQKFTLKEQEHRAELEILQAANQSLKKEVEQLQQKLVHAASGSDASVQLQETVAELRTANQQLGEQLDQSRRQCRQLEQQQSTATTEDSSELREERAQLARERAELARQRHELLNQLSTVGPHNSENQAETEMACRIRALRQHLREIHEQEQVEKAERSLTSRISNLWHRVSK